MRSILDKPGSWVIVEKSSQKAIFETFNEKVTSSINTEKYVIVPIQDYLGSLNRSKTID